MQTEINHSYRNANATNYDKQAQAFLDKHGIKFRVTLSDSKVAPWKDGDAPSGHHYRVTLSRGAAIKRMKPGSVYPERARLTFDFWGSISDAREMAQAREKLNAWRERGAQMEDAPPHLKEEWQAEMASLQKVLTELHHAAYDVLACIYSDAQMETEFTGFGEWCDDYGYDRDSIKALQTFRRCSAFSKRLKAFFTAQEIEDLS